MTSPRRAVHFRLPQIKMTTRVIENPLLRKDSPHPAYAPTATSNKKLGFFPFSNTTTTMFVLALLALLAPTATALQLHEDIVRPPSSGVRVLQLEDPLSTGLPFTVPAAPSPSGAALYAFDLASATCDLTTPLTYPITVPADGRLCYDSLDELVDAEYQDSLDYTVNGDAHSLVIYVFEDTYCPTIPELEFVQSSVDAVPQPDVAISFAGGRIAFEVSAAYLRDQASYMVDFFPFDASPAGDSADGAGRTCANHAPSTFGATPFAEWWEAAPAATWADEQPLNNPAHYLPYAMNNTRWGIDAPACDNVVFSAEFTVAQLAYPDTAADACTAASAPGESAVSVTLSGNQLNYDGTLYINALQPNDAADANAGYRNAQFEVPFTFALATVVESIEALSAKWNFEVRVASIDVIYTGPSPQLLVVVESIISDPNGGFSPQLGSEALAGFPYIGTRPGSITNVFNSNDCGTANPCTQRWSISLQEIAENQFESAGLYATQYQGRYELNWLDEDGDPLVAFVDIDVSAEDPTIDLGVGSLPARLDFFDQRSEMQDLENGQEIAEFTNGMDIWVRHTLEAPAEDEDSFEFHLRKAWVCWTPIEGFTPSLNGPSQGCRVEIPGVMEYSLNHIRRLYDEDIGQLTPTDPALEWAKVEPTDPLWTGGKTVQNGFKIAALPLIDGPEARDYYFHLISETTPRAGAKKRSAEPVLVEQVFHYRVSEDGQQPPMLLSVRQADGSVDADEEGNANSKTQFTGIVIRPEEQNQGPSIDDDADDDQGEDGTSSGGSPLPVLFAAVAGIGCLGFFIIVLVRRRNQKKKEEEGDADVEQGYPAAVPPLSIGTHVTNVVAKLSGRKESRPYSPVA